MSADGWQDCPICREKHHRFLDIGRKNMTDKEWDDFENLKKLLEENDEPVRLDYEVGISENKLAYVYFSGECQICGAVWKLNRDDIGVE